MVKLDKKYVFHIPFYKYVDNELVLIEIDEILGELLRNLTENGHYSFYITNVESYYGSNAYDEKLITVFTTSSKKPEEIFREWFLKNNKILEQNELAYEINNTMIIEKVTIQ